MQVKRKIPKGNGDSALGYQTTGRKKQKKKDKGHEGKKGEHRLEEEEIQLEILKKQTSSKGRLHAKNE